MRQFIRHIIALSVMGFAWPLAAQADAASKPRYFDAEYRIYVAGILVGRVDVQLDLSETDYRLSAHIAPAAIGWLASRNHVVATTSGRVVEAGFEPQKLDLNWVSDDTLKTTFMRYENGRPVEFASDYQPEGEQLPLQPVVMSEVGGGTLDPFTAMLLPLGNGLLVNGCDNDIQIYDGRRRTSLALIQPRIVPQTTHDYPARLTALACTISWSALGGYSKESMARIADFPPLEAHYGRITGTNYAAPLEIRGRTRFGSASIYAVRFFTERAEPPQHFDITDYLSPEERARRGQTSETR